MLASVVTGREIGDDLPHEPGVIVSNESMRPIQNLLIESQRGRHEFVRLEAETSRAITFRLQPGCLYLTEHYVFGYKNFAYIDKIVTTIEIMLL